MLMRLWREDEGVLTFEWILLLTLLVIGVIGGVAAIRDAINVECANVAGAITSVNQSYVVSPSLGIDVTSGAGGVTEAIGCSGAQGFTYSGSNSMAVYQMATSSTVPVTVTAGACGL